MCLSGTHFTIDVLKTLLMIWRKGTGYCLNMFKCSPTSNMMIWTKHEHCKAHMCPYDRNSHKVHVATRPQPSWAGRRNIFDALHFELWYTLQSCWKRWFLLFQGRGASANLSQYFLGERERWIIEAKIYYALICWKTTIWKHYICRKIIIADRT